MTYTERELQELVKTIPNKIIKIFRIGIFGAVLSYRGEADPHILVTWIVYDGIWKKLEGTFSYSYLRTFESLIKKIDEFLEEKCLSKDNPIYIADGESTKSILEFFIYLENLEYGGETSVQKLKALMTLLILETSDIVKESVEINSDGESLLPEFDYDRILKLINQYKSKSLSERGHYYKNLKDSLTERGHMLEIAQTFNRYGDLASHVLKAKIAKHYAEDTRFI